MLNSATGVALPKVPPPMSEMPATRRPSCGSRCSASATLVSGPVATIHKPSTVPAVSTRNETASSDATAPASGRAGPRRRDRSRRGRADASSSVPPSGTGAPVCTGTSTPRSCTVASALRVVCSSATFPPTVVTPRRSQNRLATVIATTSSWPGSQSRTTGSTPAGYGRREPIALAPTRCAAPRPGAPAVALNAGPAASTLARPRSPAGRRAPPPADASGGT